MSRRTKREVAPPPRTTASSSCTRGVPAPSAVPYPYGGPVPSGVPYSYESSSSFPPGWFATTLSQAMAGSSADLIGGGIGACPPPEAGVMDVHPDLEGCVQHKSLPTLPLPLARSDPVAATDGRRSTRRLGRRRRGGWKRRCAMTARGCRACAWPCRKVVGRAASYGEASATKLLQTTVGAAEDGGGLSVDGLSTEEWRRWPDGCVDLGRRRLPSAPAALGQRQSGTAVF
uniref:Uncharacterized protein n=1 Tax=Oryza meridionalis TaxID=40149 RepID=A0A0E0F5A9_9ORYZ